MFSMIGEQLQRSDMHNKKLSGVFDILIKSIDIGIRQYAITFIRYRNKESKEM